MPPAGLLEAAPQRNASISARTSRGDQIGDHRDDPLGPDGQHRQGQAVVAREDRQSRSAISELADLVERAGRLLDRDDRPELGQPLDRLGLDVPPGPARDVVEDERQVDALGDRGEVAVQPFLGGPVVIGGDEQGAVGPGPGGEPGQPDRLGRRVRPRARPSPWPGPRPSRPPVAITRSCSSCESVGDSPVVPTGLSVGVPWAICHSTSDRRAVRRPRRPGTA